MSICLCVCPNRLRPISFLKRCVFLLFTIQLYLLHCGSGLLFLKVLKLRNKDYTYTSRQYLEMTTSTNEKVLYSKVKGGSANDDDNPWDDTELLEMYKKSTSKVYEKAQNAVTENGPGGATSSIPIGQQNRKWKIGDKCMAPYEEDGKWYAATIETIDAEKGTCQVHFTEYEGCKEVVKVKDLLPEDEVEWVNDNDDKGDGTGSGQQDNKAGSDDKAGSNNTEKVQPANTNMIATQAPTPNDIIGGAHQQFTIPEHCPPPPPVLFGNAVVAGSEKEAMTNALMSWYMAGYHTGYYQGMMHQGKGNPGK